MFKMNRFNMAKSEVVYVPLPGKNNCIYPVYIPIVVREPDVYRATGRLSLGDYNSTVDNLGGNPALIPLLAALAPLIPSAISGIKKLFNKNNSTPKYRNVIPQGSYGSYSPYGPYSKGPYSQRGYHGLNENEYYRGGYIPTNPNIKNLKDLQALYNKYE
jgi:hypothetical protein